MNVIVFAGIVLYNPDIVRLKENILSVLGQVNEILLVDNNSRNINEVNQLLNVSPKISIKRNKTNQGIAYALNQILQYAKDNAYPWFLTLDQDSVVPQNLVDVYSGHLDKTCALYTCRIEDRNFNSVKPIDDIEYVNTCITSACLNNTKICSDVGGYDNVLFIDSVDHDLCIRIKKAGYRIMRINRISLSHELGHSRKVIFWGKDYLVYNHVPFRTYYIFRNRIYIGRKYNMLIPALKYLLERFILIIFFEEKKWSKVINAIKGICNGFLLKIEY